MKKEMDIYDNTIVSYVKKLGYNNKFTFPKEYTKLCFNSIITFNRIELRNGDYIIRWKNNHILSSKDIPMKQKEKILAMLANYEMWDFYHGDGK